MIQILRTIFYPLTGRNRSWENDDLQNYKAKAEYYVRQHQDNLVIAKLKMNKPMTRKDIEGIRKDSLE